MAALLISIGILIAVGALLGKLVGNTGTRTAIIVMAIGGLVALSSLFFLFG